MLISGTLTYGAKKKKLQELEQCPFGSTSMIYKQAILFLENMINKQLHNILSVTVKYIRA